MDYSGKKICDCFCYIEFKENWNPDTNIWEQIKQYLNLYIKAKVVKLIEIKHR